MNTKSELLRTAEVTQARQRRDLENHLTTAQTAAEQARTELETSRQQLEQVRKFEAFSSVFWKELIQDLCLKKKQPADLQEVIDLEKVAILRKMNSEKYLLFFILDK